MGASKTDWTEIENDYLESGLSYAQLAEKYGVSLAALKKQASRKGWAKKRSGSEQKAERVETALAKVSPQEMSPENVTTGDSVLNKETETQRFNRIVDGMLDRVEDAICIVNPSDAASIKLLTAALKDVRQPVCLTTEGMMMYFTDSEVNAVITNVRSLLETHGGCWITPDPEFILQFMLTFKAVLGDEALQKLMASRNAASGQSDAGSLTNAFIVNPMDVPASVERVAALLANHGLKTRRVNLAERLPELAVYRKLTSGQVEAFKTAMRGCHYWVITPDGHWKGGHVPQADRAFSMDYLVADGVFRASLRGRMDTITAPELLKAWEAEKGGTPITAAEIDCSRLQYISSAGLRVLLILQKGGAQVRLTGVNDAVWEILETTGFIDIFAVEREGT